MSLADRKSRCGHHDCATLPNRFTETFQLFTEGDDLYACMLAAIAGAKESIRLESYIFGGDAVGNQFCEAFVEHVDFNTYNVCVSLGYFVYDRKCLG